MPKAKPNTVMAAQAAIRFRVLALAGEFMRGYYSSKEGKARLSKRHSHAL
jgi:hypothetical protein